ncbi:MAG: pyridoxine 5'-phosphate synthase [Spirochaetes bacterium]|nr:pyridoxine 5'-phosphate synthase [Spirochaetota bacterium]
MSGITLCVNIDHIATVRQARGVNFPDPLAGARICEENGAHGITVHLREDRRHIQDRDVIALREVVRGKLNLEMALSDDVIAVARRVLPDQITLVPEKREELTTEGGLDVKGHYERIREVTEMFKNDGVAVSLFIEPDEETVRLSKKAGADSIEIHTGRYCNLFDRDPSRGVSDEETNRELNRIYHAAGIAGEIGIGLNAGHGLTCGNLPPILEAPGLEELNIGFSIIARSIFIGLPAAVREVLAVVHGAASGGGAPCSC